MSKCISAVAKCSSLVRQQNVLQQFFFGSRKCKGGNTCQNSPPGEPAQLPAGTPRCVAGGGGGPRVRLPGHAAGGVRLSAAARLHRAPGLLTRLRRHARRDRRLCDAHPGGRARRARVLHPVRPPLPYPIICPALYPTPPHPPSERHCAAPCSHTGAQRAWACCSARVLAAVVTLGHNRSGRCVLACAASCSMAGHASRTARAPAALTRGARGAQQRDAAGGLWRRAPGPQPDLRARACGAPVGRVGRRPGRRQRRRRRPQHGPGPALLRDAQRQRGHDRRQRAAVHPILCVRPEGALAPPTIG